MVPQVPHITAMEDDFLLSETNIEGTIFDPEYMQRVFEASQVGLWFWAHEAYWDWVAEENRRHHC